MTRPTPAEETMPADALDPLDPAVLEDPAPFYARLHRRAPIHPLAETGVWMVAAWSLVEEAVARPDVFSAVLSGLLVRGDDGRPQLFDLAGSGAVTDSIANADEPEHAVHRRLVQPAFAADRIARLAPELRSWIETGVDRLLAEDGGDLCDALAEPVPVLATARLLGLPLADLERLRPWALTGGEMLAGTTDLAHMAALGRRTLEMSRYLQAHLDAARAGSRSGAGEPQDLLHVLARAVEEGRIPERQGLGILVVLLGAGGESTASLIGSAVRLLAERRALQTELRREPALVPAFIEEALRLESPFRFHYRVVTREAELGGASLRRGDRLMLLWGAANRDPAVFDRPDEIDLRRRPPHRHLAFGRGLHFCVGAPLARLETQMVLESLLSRTRAFSIDPSAPPRHVPSLFVRRLACLRIRVEA